MRKMILQTGPLFGADTPIGLRMYLYDSEHQLEDGSHITVSGVNALHYLARLTDAERKDLCTAISSCFEALEKGLLKRIESEK